jgi:hypothetical protein
MPGRILVVMVLLLQHLLSPVAAAAAEEKTFEERPSPPVTRQAQGEPSMELLEFLGEFETDSGEWIDPAEIDAMPEPSQEQTHEKQ